MKTGRPKGAVAPKISPKIPNTPGMAAPNPAQGMFSRGGRAGGKANDTKVKNKKAEGKTGTKKEGAGKVRKANLTGLARGGKKK